MPKILENTKDDILRESQEMLKKKGYKEFSMRELAKNCEIGIGTVYNYFPSKQAIVNEIFNCSWNDTLYELKDLKNLEATFNEKMELIYQALEKYLKYHIDTFMEIMTDKKSSDNIECKEKRCIRKEEILEPAYIIVDEIIEIHKAKNEINIDIKTRHMSIFIITNMITIIRGTGYSFEDLMDIIKSR